MYLCLKGPEIVDVFCDFVDINRFWSPSPYMMVIRMKISRLFTRGVDGTVVSESALRSAGTLLSWFRSSPPAPWPGGGPKT
ncbi:hypothetical protein PoB_003480900 [Plakobranchus ocellatus]|uniref:Uncharacterized protein n=1 Tax=Plakobranchus ocellatus TaxID=259542 RepID=A0AAV4APS3_9GAST|nr:hypothetical protein PoB_003480900 [Plakobranchus ocellatus]